MSDSVGSVSVEVVPDARGWSEKLRAQLRDLTVKIKPELDNTALAAQIAEMKAEMEAVTSGAVDQHGRVDVDTASANAKLDELIPKEIEAGKDRTANIRVNTDKSGLSALSQFSGGLSLLPALALAAGSALIPLGAALLGVAGALAAPLAIAGGGATLFAVLGGFAIKATQEQSKQVAKLKQQLDGLQKGTKSYTDTLNKLHAAQEGMSPVQRRFGAALGDLQATFKKTFLQGSGARDLLGPMTSGLKLLTALLPSLLPIIHAVGGAFTTLLDELTAGANSTGFKSFIDAVAHQLGPDLLAFGRIAGNVVKGVSGIFLELGRTLSGPVLGGLERVTGAFSHAGESKALQSFIAYVREVGPQVGRTLGDIAGAIGHIIEAAAPIGSVVLRVFDALANAIKGIPTNVLTGLVAAFAGFAVISTVIGPLSTLVDLIGVIAAAPEVFAIVGAIVAIGAAAAIAYTKFKGFRDVVNEIGRLVGGVFTKVWHQLVTTFRSDVLPTLVQMKPDLITIGQALGRVAVFAVRVWAAIYGRLVPALIRLGGAFFKYVVPAMVHYIATVIRVIGAIARLASAFARGAARVVGAVASIVASARRLGAGFVAGVAAVVRAIGRMASAVASGVGRTVSVVRTIPGRIKGALGNLGHLLVGAGRSIVQGLINGIRSMVGAAASAAASMAEAAINAAKSHLHINSPSKVFHEIGSGIGEGLVNGIASTHRAVAGETGRLAASAIAGVGLPPSGLGGSGAISGYAPAASTSGDASIPAGFSGTVYIGEREFDAYFEQQYDAQAALS